VSEPTQGPYVVVRGISDRLFVDSTHGEAVCELVDCDEPTAHLLAASWEMREALMAARAFIEQNQPGGCDERLVMGRGVIHEPNCRACGQSKVLGSIDAALASARGEGR